MRHNPPAEHGIDKRRLSRALAAGRIYPVFQPIVHLGCGSISSFEVLARWRDDDFGDIPPATFIPLAERSRMIVPLTRYLIERACAAAVNWGGEFRLTFNISPLHFREPDFPAFIEDAVRLSGFPLSRLQIEITESAVIEQVAVARAAIDQLKARGVRIILDDFGTGFSSLTRLQALPFDKIKIDASFVGSMCELRDSRKIVSAVIGLGQSLGMPAVAEGVETEAQAQMLLQLGCDYAQGWFFGRPVSADKVPALISFRGQKASEASPLDMSCSRRLAQLEAIYAGAPVSLCFLDRRLRFVSANPKYAEMMGMRLDEIVGRTINEVFPPLLPWVLVGFGAAVHGKIPVRKCRLPDGRNVLVSVSAAHDESGEVVGLSVAMVDMPSRGSADGRLQRVKSAGGKKPQLVRFPVE